MKTTPGDIFILYLSTTNGNYMMYGSWDMECNRHNFLSLWAIFWPFIPLTTRKIKILGKWKEHLEISSVYTWVPQIDKLCTTDRFFHHVGLFFGIKWKNVWRYCHFTHVYHKWETYDAWFLRHRAWQNFFSFCTIFCPFTPWEPGKPKFWWKKRKTWRYYHFIHLYHKWKSYDVWFLRYGTWQKEFFLILDQFLP